MPTRETIKRRANKELFDTRLMDNAIRGWDSITPLALNELSMGSVYGVLGLHHKLARISY
jgi:hypothetical protein